MTPFRIALYALIFGFVLCGFVVLAKAQGFPPPAVRACAPRAAMPANLQVSYNEWPDLHLHDRGVD